MPPPAAHPDRPPTDDAGAVTLDDAAARLESALARLEALVEAGPLQSDLFRTREDDGSATPGAQGADAEALRAELDAARLRERALEAAAAVASDALGRAIVEVRHALETGGVEADEGEDADPDAPLDATGDRAEDTDP